MKKIIVTGFPPFGDYQENSSSILVSEFPKLHTFEVEFISAPISLFSSEAINFGHLVINQALNTKAEAIISLGMSSSVRGIRIESMATNWAENDKYCLESENKRKLDDKFASDFSFLVNLKLWQIPEIFINLQDLDIPYERRISTDAGNFCCNAVMFRILAAMEKYDCRIPYLFAHIPCTAEAVKTIPDFDQEKILMTKQQLKNTFVVLASFFRNK
jgi:pyrrolidone-carboxylate peptidase